MAVSIRKQVAQQIVETVKDVCGWDVNFINADGMIFASTDPSRTGAYHEIGWQAFRSGQTIEVGTDNSFLGTNKGVNLPFVYRGEVAAVIGISGPPDEVRKYAYLAQKITNMILWEHDAGIQLHQKENQLNYLIRSLVSGESINPEFMLGLLEPMHLDMNAKYRTILIQMGPLTAANNIRQALQQTGSQLFTFNYPNEYLLILEDGKYQYWSYVFRQLAEGRLLKIGIGAAEQLFRQSLSYRSAKLAIQSLLPGQNIALFDELDLELLLASVSAETREHFLEKTISSIGERERTILSTYFSCELSLKRTSERLFLHKNTLQYQLDRIARITGYDPRKFQEAVILYLGLKLEQIQGE